MGFVVFVHRPGRTVPHMEFVDADDLDQAVAAARRVFQEAGHGRYFEIWADDLLLFTSLAPAADEGGP